ncbi:MULTISPECIES: glycine amidinotransferase [Streptomyces]|uniref:glycine amidinotransferase n=1 Tax=Streptomyces TaxID=1883 RepID=UPI00163CD577|nr:MULTISPECIES: glycine amidinotransferase [Streptomyces]MBC2878290.1 glycine amidinotransferase [Streptomyces sp. TYQ1024]UBI40593.1 glycine amidinotransferase [Streptomyces mobaraensis]UKW33174.1 glycine amidinotransferase [Streptomyces sp. TYQ1024]
MSLNSYDSWSPLREVVVGSAENYSSHERELSFDLFFHDEMPYSRMYYPRHRAPGEDASGEDGTDTGARQSPIKQRYVEELQEDVEGMVDTLTSLGVTVHRPAPLAEHIEVRTPTFRAAVIPALNVRDNSIVLGDEVIETAPQVRARYFETQLLKPVFADYFRRGARWTVMPRPLMTDASFDLSYVTAHTAPGELMEPITDPRPSPYDVGHEMMIDGAQCLRLGRDVFVNVSTANHALGCDWLERHLEGRFRVHRLDSLSDSHIDSTVLALRPGLLLVRTPQIAERLPKRLRSWDMIFPPEPEDNQFPVYDDDDLLLTSRYIDLNVLSVAPDTVLVNSACPELIRTLEKHRFTVVPVRHRHRRLFGGGLHCFTLDTVREGSAPEDYLEG